MGIFGDFGKRRKPENQGNGFEYYEDTHNEYGEYVGPAFANQQNQSQPYERQSPHSDYMRDQQNDRAYRHDEQNDRTGYRQSSKNSQQSYQQNESDNRGHYQYSEQNDRAYASEQANDANEAQEKPFRMPDHKQFVSPRNYQNVVVYRPSTPEDVQILIDFLKRREPAIVNLDDMSSDASQRILDFVSGAIYALNGSVHRIAGNIFLLSPEGVEITVPYEQGKKG